ncbi:polysaccharide biosynthesis protein [Defluviimonas sp. WL0002]|uniref:Polysaccharide biosynthesis protein n=1 Tax=Albidovulum marisflavi TaxID=2984159 RepID=A0ABT2ZG90_9RHOB|nr:polysaccharide biosynthesis protein [Defluviimonas sp. WL0002]MCV2870150.1 polysaccharide biosynthesis protein [Defluviimonas sp. WL0002]
MQRADRQNVSNSLGRVRLVEAAGLVSSIGICLAPDPGGASQVLVGSLVGSAFIILCGIFLARREAACASCRRRIGGAVLLWASGPLASTVTPAAEHDTTTAALVYAIFCILLQLSAPARRAAPDVDAEAIIRRPPHASAGPWAEMFRGRSILVTGAGGSIGSEICRQLISHGPARLVLLDLSEPALFEIDRKLRGMPGASAVQIVPILGSVTEEATALRSLLDQEVGIVLHAAAYKHVPMVEANPRAGLATNTLGTLVMARAAQQAGVERFVLISTDKAVRPRGVLGISKLLAEQVVLDLASRPGPTIFSAVRFGNVFGSSGSVVPLFLEQIADGGPVTVTDPSATRYFMTVREAVGLVLSAAAIACGGEVFVLDMGEPIAIGDLARRLIAAAAPRGAAISIRTTGLRPGEKQHEDLSSSGALAPTSVPGVLLASTPVQSQIEVAATMRSLRRAVAGDDTAARAFIAGWLSGQTQPGEMLHEATP